MRLSFVEYDADGRVVSAWSIPPPKDYTEDIECGKARAQELASYISDTGDVPIFKRIIRDMQLKPAGGAEVGFLSQIATYIKRAAVLGSAAFICKWTPFLEVSLT